MVIHRKCFNRRQGFTLVELMVTIAVAAVLISLAVPSFRDLIATTELRAAASTISTSFLKARSEAAKRDQSVIVKAKSNNWLNGWQVLASDSSVILDQEPLRQISFISPPSTTLTYSHAGRLVGGPVNFELGSNKIVAKKRCVSIDASGYSSVKESAC